MITARAPGKLFIVGEYAVVEAGEPAALVAVNRYLSVTLTKRKVSRPEGTIRSNHYGPDPIGWSADDSGDVKLAGGRRDPLTNALSAAMQLAAESGLPLRAFDLAISSELDDPSGRKFGLGSSGAVTVAAIRAVAEFYELPLTPWKRFQLACLATVAGSPRASCGDVAASTFGGWLRYSSPDRAALSEVRTAEGIAAALASGAWEPCRISHLPAPKDLQLLVGWTGAPAQTDQLVGRVRPANRPATTAYPGFLTDSRNCVDAFSKALATKEREALGAIRQGRSVLQRLGLEVGTNIETGRLGSLCDIVEHHGGAAKPSGAGGGDCGIGLVADSSGIVTRAVFQDWEDEGILPLDLDIHPAEGDPGER